MQLSFKQLSLLLCRTKKPTFNLLCSFELCLVFFTLLKYASFKHHCFNWLLLQRRLLLKLSKLEVLNICPTRPCLVGFFFFLEEETQFYLIELVLVRLIYMDSHDDCLLIVSIYQWILCFKTHTNFK